MLQIKLSGVGSTISGLFIIKSNQYNKKLKLDLINQIENIQQVFEFTNYKVGSMKQQRNTHDAKNQFGLKRIEPTSFVLSKEYQLGKGAFGQVFLGFDQKNRYPVAIKTISQAKMSQSNINRQVLAQKIAAQLGNMQLARSDRLVRLISPHQSTKNMYLVCQYCNGGSLKQYLNKKGVLAQSEAICIFKDILEGFKCLHSNKIVHRDLKPANILIHNHRIKIGDLGFSKSIEGHQQLLTSIVGSPLYMSPQILTNSQYTQKTDIWSLGIIMYQILVGEAPWKVNSIQQIKQKVKYKPQFPKSCHINLHLKNLILRMLEYEQKNRIGWEELFDQYLKTSSYSDSMDQQKQEPYIKTLRSVNDHFMFSIAIQSQHHIVYMLHKNNIKTIQFWQNCATAKQYFTKIKQLRIEHQQIQACINSYVQQRNCTAFLMRLFMQCFDKAEQLHSPLVYTALLMIIKYCIVRTQQLLTQTLFQSIPNIQIFLHSIYYTKLKSLLQLDLIMLKELFKMFFTITFVPKMKLFFDSHQQVVLQIEKNLKPFFDQQSASIKFTQFWMKNCCRQLFNAFKDLEELPDKWMLIPRMIYQYEKSSKTHLFANPANENEKPRIAKKIQLYSQQEKWKVKLKQIKKFEIESLNSFINRQILWNPFNIIGRSFANSNIPTI